MIKIDFSHFHELDSEKVKILEKVYLVALIDLANEIRAEITDSTKKNEASYLALCSIIRRNVKTGILLNCDIQDAIFSNIRPIMYKDARDKLISKINKYFMETIKPNKYRYSRYTLDYDTWMGSTYWWVTTNILEIRLKVLKTKLIFVLELITDIKIGKIKFIYDAEK